VSASAAPDPRAPDKGRAVRGMFASIAPRYDLLNALLSLGQDRRWRRDLVRQLPVLRAGDRVLDLCTGTADVAVAIASAARLPVHVHASDFCEEMLLRAAGKRLPAGAMATPTLLAADVLALPYPAGRFRAVTVAFGLRNVQDPRAGIREMARVLAPGGRLLILEFAKPDNRLFAGVYRFYFFRVLPVVGRLLSGSRVDAYRYLPESVWAFPDVPELARAIEATGLRVLEHRRHLFGAVMLHVAERPGP
jgi:demethylmenaquinone methyltransferase/2-methoxy-6-polyprenyl-1,4-benzoquinol methylase